MGMYDKFETDPIREEEGVILDYDDFRVRIAAAGQGNKNYLKTVERVMRPYRAQIRSNTLGEATSRKLLVLIFAESIVLDWEVKTEKGYERGIESRDGTIMEFTKENVIDTLTALPNLFLDIQQQASETSLFLRSALEEDAKN